MSYILDALKKSEKERQHGTAPDILTAQDVQAQEPKKRPLWPYLLLVALLLNAGVLLLWLGPWHSKKPHVVVQSVGGQQHESDRLESANNVSDARSPITASTIDTAKTFGPKVGAVEKHLVPESELVVPKPDEKLVKTVREDQPVESKADMKGSLKVSPSVPKQPAVVSQVPSESKPDNNIVSTVENKVYNLKDLPLSIQQGLPDFNITVAIYSNDPASRMVKINGQLMREGQYLTAGLKLEEITQDGVIFSYQNYRFRVGMK
jgi:general secretion pathway protein B